MLTVNFIDSQTWRTIPSNGKLTVSPAYKSGHCLISCHATSIPVIPCLKYSGAIVPQTSVNKLMNGNWDSIITL